MHRLVFPLLLIAAVPAGAHAQPASLRGVEHTVPQGYTRAAGLGDSATAVFTGARSAVALAALPGGTDRAAVIQHLRGVLAGAASGRDPGTFRWRLMVSGPLSPYDVFHERWTGTDGRETVIARFSHLRKDGRNLLLATAFATAAARTEDFGGASTFTVTDFSTLRVAGVLLTELVGAPPYVEDCAVDFSGTGGTLREPPTHPEEAAIRATFEAYRAALLGRDGQAALPHMAEAVFEYYAGVQRLALYATAAEVRARPLPDQLFVLMLRTRVPPQRLREMSPRELFAHAVEQGWIGEEGTRTQQVGNLSITGDMAVARVLQGGRVTPLKFSFVRQDGAWKWDMLGVIHLMDPVFRQLAEENGVEPEDLLVRMVESVTERKLPRSAWDAPPQR